MGLNAQGRSQPRAPARALLGCESRRFLKVPHLPKELDNLVPTRHALGRQPSLKRSLRSPLRLGEPKSALRRLSRRSHERSECLAKADEKKIALSPTPTWQNVAGAAPSSENACEIASRAGKVVATGPVMDRPKRYVYVLQSERSPDRHYVGLSGDVAARVASHNKGEPKHTAINRPWILLTAIEFRNPASAAAFERYQKSGSGRAFAKRYFV